MNQPSPESNDSTGLRDSLVIKYPLIPFVRSRNKRDKPPARPSRHMTTAKVACHLWCGSCRLDTRLATTPSWKTAHHCGPSMQEFSFSFREWEANSPGGSGGCTCAFRRMPFVIVGFLARFAIIPASWMMYNVILFNVHEWCLRISNIS